MPEPFGPRSRERVRTTAKPATPAQIRAVHAALHGFAFAPFAVLRAVRGPNVRSRHSPSFAPFAVQTSVRAARAQAQADCAPADTRRPPLRLCRPCPGGPGGRRSRGCRRCRPGRKAVCRSSRALRKNSAIRSLRSLVWITCAIRGCHSELAFLTPGHSTQDTKKGFTREGAGQAANQHR